MDIDPEHVHHELTSALRRKRAADHDVAVLLTQVLDERLYIDLGYATFADYADRGLGLAPRTARALVLLSRSLKRLPTLDRAVASGEVPWTKAREIARVATDETEAAWIAAANELTSRQLEARVRVAHVGQTPADVNAQPEQPARRTLVFRDVAAQGADLIEDALTLLRQQTGLPAQDFDRGEAMVALAQWFLAQAKLVDDGGDSRDSDSGETGHVRDGDGDSDSDSVSNYDRDRVAHYDRDRNNDRDRDDVGRGHRREPHRDASNIPTGHRHQLVVHECHRCGEVRADRAPVDETAISLAHCDATVVDMRPGPARGHTHSRIRPALRTAVLVRDGHQCIVPGCTCRLWLDIHHVLPRARGGTNQEDNLVSLCSLHHHLLHDGRMALHRRNDSLIVQFGHSPAVHVDRSHLTVRPGLRPSSEAHSPGHGREAGAEGAQGSGPTVGLRSATSVVLPGAGPRDGRGPTGFAGTPQPYGPARR